MAAWTSLDYKSKILHHKPNARYQVLRLPELMQRAEQRILLLVLHYLIISRYPPPPEGTLLVTVRRSSIFLSRQVIFHITTCNSTRGPTWNISRVQYWSAVYTYINTTHIYNEKTDIISKIDDATV
jgi:hypothetical protein